MMPGGHFRDFLQRVRASLAAKFVLLTSLITLAVFLITGLYTYTLEWENERSRLLAKSLMLAEFVAAISPDRIFSYDYSSLHLYVKQLSAFPDVRYAVILDEHGRPVTAYLNRDIPVVREAIEAVGGPDVIQVANRLDGMKDAESISTPIRSSNRILGTVRLGVSRKHAEEALSRALLLDVAGILLAISLLGVGILYVFKHHVLRPTLYLIKGAQRVAQGNLVQPIPVASVDELGRVSQSFNEMMDNLARSQAERTQALEELRELNHTLEIRVEERTRAIESVNKELERLALHDSLTDLPNRMLLRDRMEQHLLTAERSQTPFVVMLMDLDGFKEVNDTFGHHTGDLVLKKVSQRLAATLRDTDTVSRLGGDEFAILLPDTRVETAVTVANKIFLALKETIEVEGLSFIVTASLGMAVYPEHGKDTGLLLKHADIAMYEAKQTKTGYCIYHRDIDTHSPRRLALMNDLRAAVEARHMSLQYQSIMDLASGTVRGVEALARWTHPEKGNVPPDQFIPMIEQTGLIHSFSRWVIDTALAQWAAWRDKGIDIVMSVNLSMRNLQDKDFPLELEDMLRKWSVTPHSLLLEITESAMMSDPDHVLEILSFFNRMGVGIAIDDFGTGYSSLSHLKRLPVNEIKIDREFVKDMSHDKDDAVIVRSTIDLAHNLGLRVVAEGVEDDATLHLLKELGCDLAQGDLFSRPVPAELVKFLKPVKVRSTSRA